MTIRDWVAALALAMLWEYAEKPRSDTERIQACTETHEGEHCYALAADVTHLPWGRGTTVERIHFDNGGWLDFDHVRLPGSGVSLPSDGDDRERGWSFGRLK